MKSRLLTTTAALSVALSTFQPLPLVAQEDAAARCAANPEDCPPGLEPAEDGEAPAGQDAPEDGADEGEPDAPAAEEGAAAGAEPAPDAEGEAEPAAAAEEAPPADAEATGQADAAEPAGAAVDTADEPAGQAARPVEPAPDSDAADRPVAAEPDGAEAEGAEAEAETERSGISRILNGPEEAAPAGEEAGPAEAEQAGEEAPPAEGAARSPDAPEDAAVDAEPTGEPDQERAVEREAAPDADELRRRLEADAEPPVDAAPDEGQDGAAATAGATAAGEDDGAAETAPETGASSEAEGEVEGAGQPDGEAEAADLEDGAPGAEADRAATQDDGDATGGGADRAGAQADGEAEAARTEADEDAAAESDQTTAETEEAERSPADQEEARSLLSRILESEEAGAGAVAAAAASADDAGDAAGEAREAAGRAEEITEDNSRSSDEEFRTLLDGSRERSDSESDRDSGLSNFEKFGLLALGGLAVGAMLNNRDEVVSNSGDRVVVQRSDGTYSVLKDDDTLLRRPGSEVVTQSFDDGSTRAVVTRADGTQIVTIRDGAGRVLRRTAIDRDGREVRLIDDLAPVERVDVSRLPEPAPGFSFVETTNGRELRQALEQARSRTLDRTYSLRQIREYREVRALAPAIDVDQITFATGSAAIDPGQAERLAVLGQTIADMVAERPGEVFLIEGHTDAVGDEASNLALSDRRAESVALALSEYFDVPPENMVVQGYGEGDLRIDTDGPEQRNRRVAVRLITPLMRTASN
ncbi:OmpA family protein [Cereibacter azotoformans]|uniref:Outer membrane protein OmpA-like peptidoglycan-associated protein n=1 Tax=Cereibacter azotoformans TaxID=43057 RepID=A0A2T5KEQ8_9RHOB|nr:OmpA family protein [Cereibacter azotoformans]MBO4169826.1 OmpA family protein [Cereibacter azotoformans]PTR20915.1 outer membrane protein OmpA-like peptidoglycan-associated protein [Cereibacter azotoformans]UIJ30870.1 OmpA family protein [Cereibacter azotoformans]